MTPVWPRAYPATGAAAVLKARPEDFRVSELPDVLDRSEHEREGEHLYLRLEKTGLTTPELADRLAIAFAVERVAVGYAGMKDRQAVTEQWFSVQTAAPVLADVPAGVRVLQTARRPRKLRRGELAGNRFRICLREVTGTAWQERLALIRAHGVPNYFGPQRFGSDNLERALGWLPERRRRRVSRFRQGLLLSVLRSYLFNEVLAARVRDGSWNRLLAGDVSAAPTGPLWGRGRPPVTDAVAALERDVLAAHGTLLEGLEHAGLSQDRRPLVLRAEDLTWRARDGVVELEFTLPPGCYATVLLAEAFDLVFGVPIERTNDTV